MNTQNLNKVSGILRAGSFNKILQQPQQRVTSHAIPRGAEEGTKKAKDAFRTISEVANRLGVQQHVLRFWETKFSQVRPLKRGGGRRYYRPEDVALLQRIHHLLYTEGYTIKGVQKLLKEQGKAQVIAQANNTPNNENNAPVAPAPKVPTARTTTRRLLAVAKGLELSATRCP